MFDVVGYPIAKSVLRWGAVFLIPVPISVAISYCVIFGVGGEQWGAFSSWLYGIYAKVGLRGSTFLFSWAWSTTFLLLGGIPYGILVVTVNRTLFSQKKTFRLANMSVSRFVSYGVAFVMSVPITLIFSRLAHPFAFYILSESISSTTHVQSSAIQSILALVMVYGIPYAVICLIVSNVWVKKIREERIGEKSKV